MDELSLADIGQQYNKNIIMYRGTPVYVQDVETRNEIIIRDLLTSVSSSVPFNLKDFQPHKGRLGMVNYNKSCGYLSRIPARKMGIGINVSNIHVIGITELHATASHITQKSISQLNCVNVGKTIVGDYPSFIEAFDEVLNAEEGCIIRAFDRQFAISTSKSIYYKGVLVGTVTKKATTVKDIRFSEGFEHLEQLL